MNSKPKVSRKQRRHSEVWYAIKRKVKDPDKFWAFYKSKRNAEYMHQQRFFTETKSRRVVKVRITEI